jgi:hypothetical protein
MTHLMHDRGQQVHLAEGRAAGGSQQLPVAPSADKLLVIRRRAVEEPAIARRVLIDEDDLADGLRQAIAGLIDDQKAYLN